MRNHQRAEMSDNHIYHLRVEVHNRERHRERQGVQHRLRQEVPDSPGHEIRDRDGEEMRHEGGDRVRDDPGGAVCHRLRTAV